MNKADLAKLQKVVQLTLGNVSREVITEFEILFFTLKSTLDDAEKREMLDEAFKRLRGRVLDISGAETQRLIRYLNDWEVEQTSKKLDWVEFGPRLDEKKEGRK